MKYKRPIAFLLAGFLLSIVIIYFIVHPFFFETFRKICVHNLSSLEDARNYYAVLASISSTAFSFFGLLLGYYYFVYRQRYDERKWMKEKYNNNVDALISLIDKIDDSVDELLGLMDSKNQDAIRHKIRQSFEIASAILENYPGKGSLDNQPLFEAYIAFYSFVDKNVYIMEEDLKMGFSRDVIEDIKGSLRPLVTNVRRNIYLHRQQNVESVNEKIPILW
ncbi:hypothetical protein [Desulfocurvibacter africanus]|uniref:hypothetical protein n=1 Tax=Desulfocurvibacter africanus TaxID=873 RepID=UPI0004828ED5|nr:hypothetical protein [Desulfocurvibacter africanus]